MRPLLLVALNLSTLEILIIFIAAFSFIALFAISSAKGGYKDLIETTLKNDQTRRLAKKK